MFILYFPTSGKPEWCSAEEWRDLTDSTTLASKVGGAEKGRLMTFSTGAVTILKCGSELFKMAIGMESSRQIQEICRKENQ